MLTRILHYLLLLLLYTSCSKNNTSVNKDSQYNILLDSIKAIQYEDVNELERLSNKLLRNYPEEKAQFIGKYYKVKASYFKRIVEEDIKELESIYQEIESKPEFEDIRLEINFMLLNYYYSVTDFKKVIALLDKSEYLYETRYSLVREAILYALSSEISHIDNSLQLNQLRSIIDKNKDQEWNVYKSKLHESLVHFLVQTNNKDEALKELENIIELNKKHKLHNQLIKQLITLAYMRGDQISIDTITQALNLINETGHTKCQFLAYRTLGHVYFEMKEFDKAYNAFQKSIDSYKSISGKIKTPIDYAYMGWALFHVDKQLNFKKADSLVNLAANWTGGTEYENLLVRRLGLTRKSWMYRAMGLKKKELEIKEKITALNYDISLDNEKAESFQLSSYLKLSSKDNRINELALQNRLNEAELNQQKTFFFFTILASALIIFILLSGLLAVIYFKNKKFIESKNNMIRIFQQNLILENRLKNIEASIAEDLHDNFGNRITGVITSLGILKELNMGPLGKNKKVYEKFATHVETNLTSLDADIKDLMWALNSKNNNLSAIVTRMSKMISTTFADNNIELHTNEISEDIKLPQLANKQLMLIVKEAITNALKHSGSEKIEVYLRLRDNYYFEILVKDYGKGFELSEQKRINGINNMTKRADSINFLITIISNNLGTTILLQNKEPLIKESVAE